MRNTSVSAEYRETQSADDEHDFENFGGLRVLLPGAQVTNLERPSPARIDSEVENLMSRRARDRAVERERRLADLPDESARNGFSPPRIAGPRSSRQRNLERVAAIESKLAPVVVPRNK